MRIGVFGGTFDPPHLGHLILADEALGQLRLDHILWVLTPLPPHKKDRIISPIQHRMSMVLLAISGNPRFKFSRVDIDRLPPHYAVDTMSILRKSSSVDEYFYLMGADSLNDLPTWHKPDKFLLECDGLGVMLRQGETINTDLVEVSVKGVKQKLQIFETPIIQISGSDIRKRVRMGIQFRYLVPNLVFQYILNHKLYQS